MEVEEKVSRLQELAGEWSACNKCGLCEPTGRQRRNVVFGEGNPDADLMIIGEAPSEKEDQTGSPFQGKSGEVLNMLLEAFGSDRDEVFITNIVGCRSTEEEDPGVNRAPNKQEIAACIPRVSQILHVVDPYVVLLLGTSALALTDEKGSISKFADDAMTPGITVSVPGLFVQTEWPAFATWHPSFLLRHWDMRKGGPVDKAYSAFRKAFAVADMFAELYEGRQRGPREVENG